MVGSGTVYIFEEWAVAKTYLDQILSLVFTHARSDAGVIKAAIVHGAWSRPEASSRVSIGWDHAVIVVICIHDKSKGELFLITQAHSPCGLELGLTERWE
jgi:hypothetical protein